ncbi:MAG: hypothetical protein KDE04_08020 [Anaerolineales bacterium]|nr:hypothetical protein [Anaerolineales bacterium]
MPSHFSTIGIPVTSEQDFIDIGQRAARLAERHKVQNGAYYCWQDESGAALWLQLDENDQLIGINPHFHGQALFQVAILTPIKRPHDSPLDGAIRGWANGTAAAPDSGDFPFVFDLPNLALHPELHYPAQVTIRLAAFAHELTLYESAAAFAKRPDPRLQLAAQAFIPTGLFTENDEPPAAQAVFTGTISAWAQKQNGLTGQPFYWFAVETLGGSIDVVADPTLVPQEPVVGGHLEGSFWLTGTLL